MKERNNEKLLEYSKWVYPELLSPDEKEALKDYSDLMYKSINRGLRTGLYKDNLHVMLIDNAILKFKFDEELVVYRNMGFDEKRNKDYFLKQLENGKYHEHAYLSTSLSSKNFMFGNDIRLEINVPAFYNGACIRELAMVPEENEYLMCRDTELEILSIKPNKHKKYIIEPEILVKARVIK